MKTKFVLGIGLATCVTAVAVAFIPNDVTKLSKATTNSSYTCASIHFGMHDDDCTAMTYSGSTQASNLNNYCDVSGVTITDQTLTNVYHGGTYTNSNTDYSSYAWKLGGSKKKPVMNLTFAETIIGVNLYVVGFGTDPTTIKVQDEEYELTTSASDVTKANAEVVTYEKVTFTFAPTNTLSITTKFASKTVNGKSVSACRFFLADISFRIAN